MKKLLVVLVLLFVASSFVSAQGNGGSGSGGSGSGNNHGNGSQVNAWSQSNWPGVVQNWLQNGGQGAIPQMLMARVRQGARPWLVQTFGLSAGQVAQKWANGEIVVLYLPTSPPSPVLSFRVSFGGGLIIIEIGDDA